LHKELKAIITVWPIKYSDILAASNSEELIGEYAKECSIAGIGEINPQPDIYERLEQNGAMQSFAASDGHDLVGFANLLVTVLPHYGRKCATVESLFVASAHRKSDAGAQLMAIMESYAHDMGCEGILYSAPSDGRLERLLECKKNYQRTNAIFFRRFD
jgi:GNAT superfamily N-acetyltransferase